MCGGSYAFWFSLIKYRLAKPLPCLFLFSQDNSFMHTAEKPGEGSVLTRKVSKCCDSLHSGSDQSSRWPSSICLFHVVLYAQASMILPLLNLTFSPSRDISKLLALIPLTSCNITQVLESTLASTTNSPRSQASRCGQTGPRGGDIGRVWRC